MGTAGLSNFAAGGVGYALLSLLFAGLNDIAFKRYSLSGASRGMLVLGVGVTWTALQLALVRLDAVPFAFDATTAAFGAAAGVLLVGSNLLLLEAFTRVDLSLGSTVYRLNTVAVVVLSWWLLDEPLGAAKLGGVTLGVLAVILLSHRPAWHPAGEGHAVFVAYAIAAALLRAGYGVLTRKAMLAHASPAGVLLAVSCSWIVGGAAYALARDGRLRLTRAGAGYAAVSGTFVWLVVYFLLRAVEVGEASIVIPIANMSFVVALAASLATGMERPTPRKALAVGCAVGAILLLARA